MDQSKTPSRKECVQLFAEQKLPKNLIDHIMLVNRIAVFLAEKLMDAGIPINVDLVDKASLLHDISKPVDFGRATTLHARAGAELLLKKGYPEISEIARKHLVISICSRDPKDQPFTWEEKVVYYSDKRENNNDIVSVKDRLLGWKEMHDPSEFSKYFEAISTLEREIFNKLPLRPDQLRDAVLKWHEEQ